MKLKRPIIIDIVGTHSTGKTTAINCISRYLERTFKYRTLKVVHEESVSRTDLKDMDFGLYGSTTDFEQAWISVANWMKILHSMTAKSADITLCTDLGIRSLSYALMCDLKQSTINFHENMISFLHSEFFQKNVDIYHIYLPIEFPIVEDDVRIKNEEFRSKHDIKILNIFYDLNVPKIPISGTHKERKIKLENWVDEMILNQSETR